MGQVTVKLHPEILRRKLAGIFGCEHVKTGGERGVPFEQDQPSLIILWADTSKGRAYRQLDRMFQKLSEAVRDGTPTRTTDQSRQGHQRHKTD